MDVKDKIVLLDIDSGFNWLTLASLGARAVVFIERSHVTSKDYASKVINVPLRFPRALIRIKDAKELLRILSKGSVTAELNLDIRWTKVNLTNIIALIPGSHKDEIVIIATHYDTHSTIPGLLLSARNVFNTAVLLEFARLVKMNKPLRSILITFFSGSAISMAGVREFVKKLSYGEIEILGNRWWWLWKTLAFAFDLYPSSSPLMLLAQGNFYGGFDWERAPVRNVIDSLLKYVTSIGKYSKSSKVYVIHGKRYHIDVLPSYLERGVTVTTTHYLKAKHIAEVFNHAGIPSVTFYTPNREDCLLSTIFSESTFQLLRPQLEVSFFLLYSLINDQSRLAEDIFIQRVPHYVWGLRQIRGKVIYPSNIGIKKEEVKKQYLTIVYVKSPYHDFIVSTDNEGCFEVYGLKSRLWWTIVSIPYEISAFLIDRENGKIMCASKSQNILDLLRWYWERLNLTLFRCGSIALHGVFIDTNTFRRVSISKRDIKILESTTLIEISTWNFTYPTLQCLVK